MPCQDEDWQDHPDWLSIGLGVLVVGSLVGMIWLLGWSVMGKGH